MCEFEDSQNCIWIAFLQGNNEGNSFVNIAGTILYAEHLALLAVLLFILWSVAVIAHDVLSH